MSWTNIELIKQILNKNILFIDLETTGLVKNAQGFELPPEEKYPNYTENEHYNQSRIVQIGYVYCKNFHFEDISVDNISSIIIKPNGFTIPIEASNIHGITTETANKEGTKSFDVFKHQLTPILKECDFIIGYNIFFDVNVLLNELYRSKFPITINKINKLIDTQHVLCTAILSKEYIIKKFRQSYFKKPHSIPSQKVVYKTLFNNDIQNAHNAKYDILATIQITNKLVAISDNDVLVKNFPKQTMNNHFNVSISNFNAKWTQSDETQLILLLSTKKSWEDVGKLLGRSVGSIRAKVQRIACKFHVTGMSDNEIMKKLNITKQTLQSSIKRYKNEFSNSDDNIITENNDKLQNSLLLMNKLNEITDKHIDFYNKTGKHLFGENFNIQSLML